ncbi:MAG: fructosamine kinase family protein [Acidobacteria bacterium]|nr:fructosamine kinase family protein [Acidobacteriota bacterium]
MVPSAIELDGQKLIIHSARAVSGGCIHRSFYVETDQGRFFVKRNDREAQPLFRSEMDGLQALRQVETSLHMPRIIGMGTWQNQACLVLEWLDLVVPAQDLDWHKLAEGLAELHCAAVGHLFGWPKPGFIGATPQIEGLCKEWPECFLNLRLGYLWRKAREQGLGLPPFDSVFGRFENLIQHGPQASLVHGDLWSGNVGFTRSGQPVLFDPACYWADREVDLAMATLFGGFPKTFWATYFACFPLPPGWQERQKLYNLYHLLNHYLLFGGSYGASVLSSVAELTQL